jgi:5'-3' exonuclease
MKVHLIDGTYELFRSFYGVPGRQNPNGDEVGAVLGLCRGFSALLRNPEVTHLGCAFDTVIESFRNELFGGYKTGEGIDPALWAQFPLAERLTREMGITTWSMIEFEADDALATAAARAEIDPRVDQVVICSPDKDLAQCVRGERVVCWDRMRDRVYDEAGVAEKFGVAPAAIPDLLALVGDTADGIPGIEKWGMKSAAVVLARYGRIDLIPDDAASWDVPVRGKSALASTLSASRDDSTLYRTLATLRTDVPLAESVDDLRWTGPRRPGLDQLLVELGDSENADRLEELARSRGLY